MPSVSNQTGDEIDEKVGRAAVAGVFNLGDILELVNDGLDYETFACQQLVLEKDESIAHVFANRGYFRLGRLVEVNAVAPAGVDAGNALRAAC